MTTQEQTIFLLGYIKATLEWFCSTVSKDQSSEIFNLLVDFEQYFNQEINRIFYEEKI